MKKKIVKLHKELSKAQSALIAYSGGVDSALLLYFAQKTIQGRVLAVTCVSALSKSRDIDNSKRIAKELKAEHRLIHINELKNPDIIKNDKLRCYYCKKELFSRLKEIAAQENLEEVFDGSNADDLDDYRPGMQAIRELGIRSPLLLAGLTKEEIRKTIRREGLSFYDLEALACLGSRFPYGIRLKKEALKRIDATEDFLTDLGFHNVRVRHYNELAKIEVDAKDIPKAFGFREEIAQYFKDRGYRHITLDLEGYKMGSLNQGIIQKGGMN